MVAKLNKQLWTDHHRYGGAVEPSKAHQKCEIKSHEMRVSRMHCCIALQAKTTTTAAIKKLPFSLFRDWRPSELADYEDNDKESCVR